MRTVYSELDELIFCKWYYDRLTFCEIAQIKLPSFLSLQRIRNIIYAFGGNRKDCYTDNVLVREYYNELYKLFRIKMLELQDVDAAIKFVHENQPRRRYSQHTIRRCVNREIQNRNIVK